MRNTIWVEVKAAKHLRGSTNQCSSVTQPPIDHSPPPAVHSPSLCLLISLSGEGSGRCEEFTAKFQYWGELPHLQLGMYPEDDEGRLIARQVVGQGHARTGVLTRSSTHLLA
eukprot:6897898-Pyramimonas_sp.AAC.1